MIFFDMNEEKVVGDDSFTDGKVEKAEPPPVVINEKDLRGRRDQVYVALGGGHKE